MGRIIFDLTLCIILLLCIGYVACWRMFFKVGKVADNEITKIKNEVHKDEEEKH
jgi:hypothetical protein